jgi:hypothetical protein
MRPSTNSEPTPATGELSLALLLGPQPAFIPGEGAHDYEALLARVSAALAPRDVMEEMWIRDVVDLAWEIFRLRRMKSNLLRVRAWKALWEVLSPIVGADAYELAERWCARDQAAIDEVGAALDSAGLSLDTVMAHGLAREMDEVERIEAMVANAEKRRSEALRQIEQYRASFALELREATEDAGGAVPNAPARVPEAAAKGEGL